MIVTGWGSVGGWVMKITPKKSNNVFDFFCVIFVTYRESCDDCNGGGSAWVVGR